MAGGSSAPADATRLLVCPTSAMLVTPTLLGGRAMNEPTTSRTRTDPGHRPKPQRDPRGCGHPAQQGLPRRRNKPVRRGADGVRHHEPRCRRLRWDGSAERQAAPQEEISKVNDHVTFVQGLAGIPGLIAAQVEGVTSTGCGRQRRGLRPEEENGAAHPAGTGPGGRRGLVGDLIHAAGADEHLDACNRLATSIRASTSFRSPPKFRPWRRSSPCPSGQPSTRSRSARCQRQ